MLIITLFCYNTSKRIIKKGDRMLKFYCYKRCGTCKKALKYLEEKGVDFEYYEITENHFTPEDVKGLHDKSQKDLKKLFNTSGNVYKDLNLKDKLKDMPIEEAYNLLASNGMLIKRPILISDNAVLFGFKDDEYGDVINHVK
jgi:arsenate reductase (glutaredoxin)